MLSLTAIAYAEDVPFPQIGGGYNIGQIQWTFKDFSRSEVLAPKNSSAELCTSPGAWRSIPLTIYYPVDFGTTNATNTRAQYIPSSVARALGLPGNVSNLRKRAFPGAPISREKDKFPVIIFSPGLEISTIFYTALLEELAAHGFIIFAVSHPYMSGQVYIPENDCILAQPPLPTERTELLKLLDKMIGENIKDFDFISLVIKKLNASAGGFKNKIDEKNIIFMGHSGGGMSATIHCSRDTIRCAAAINLDGGHIDGDDIEIDGAWITSKRTPYLKIHSASFPGKDQIPPSLFGKNQFLLDINRIDHRTFSDLAFFPGRILDPNGHLLSAQDSHHLIGHHLLAFLDAVVKEKKFSWPRFSPGLEKELKRFPRASK